ncbi:Hypothetical protein, putative [Bodo saltans]|uniref:Uncharacterized protein n=1 Tax=Bodo saltans TaxID=75058 RepID=A0A0S4IL24_BODSA|nr:Hypothetical protein, putative [Bodo saltans]|eukprot:CUE70459.1 Hypothetical protein, putative [Bodo saltans]
MSSSHSQQQQYVVSIKFKRFVLDEGARPQGNTAQRSLLAKPFAITWSMVSHGPQAFTGATCGSSFKSTANVLQCDWRSAATTEIVLDHTVLSNAGARVVLLRIMDLESMNSATANEAPLEEDPAVVLQYLRSSVSGRGKGAPVLASATVDPGAFLKQPARDYCVKMESQFATVGKLYFNLVVELLEAKRFGERAILERRLVLRIDRVVPHKPANNGLRHRASQHTLPTANGGGEQQQPTSATASFQQQPLRSASSSSVMSPLGIQQRATSDVSSASNGSSLGPISSTPLLNTPTLSAALRPGGEYTIKVRLSSGKTVYRTPLSICDADGRIRWNYELTIPLPSTSSDNISKKKSQQPINTSPSATTLPLDPNIATVSNSSMTSHPGGGGGASNDSTTSSVNPTSAKGNAGGGAVSFADKNECKLQVALLEGQQVVSAFGIDVARLRSGRNWTEVAVPSPFSAIRYEKDGSMQTITGSVLFEWSVRETEALKLKAESPLGTPKVPSRSSSNRESGESTPVVPPPAAPFPSQPQSRTASAGGIRRKVNTQVEVAPIIVSHSPSSPLSPSTHPSPFHHPTTAKVDSNRQLPSVHSFGESLCSNPPTPLQPTLSPPPARQAHPQSHLHLNKGLTESSSSPNGAMATMPPTPSTQAQGGPMTLSSGNSLWEPFGNGPSAASAALHVDPLRHNNGQVQHTNGGHRNGGVVYPASLGADRKDDVSPTPGLSNTLLPDGRSLNHYDTLRRLSATESYAQLQSTNNHSSSSASSSYHPPPQYGSQYSVDELVSALSTVDRVVDAKKDQVKSIIPSSNSTGNNINQRLVVKSEESIAKPTKPSLHVTHEIQTTNAEELQQQVLNQNQRINELQRQLSILQQQQSASRSSSMMSSATRTTGTAQSSLMAGWGSSVGNVDGGRGRWRSPSSEEEGGYYRSGSETGSRRATPQRTHSLSREEVHLAVVAEGSSRRHPTNVANTKNMISNDKHRTPPREHQTWVAERSSPAPHDPRRHHTTTSLVTDDAVSTSMHNGRGADHVAVASRVQKLETASKSRWR